MPNPIPLAGGALSLDTLNNVIQELNSQPGGAASPLPLPTTQGGTGTTGGPLKGYANNKLVLAGHSYSAYNSDADSAFGSATAAGTGGKSYSRGVAERTNQVLGSPFRIISNLGVPGTTSTQILAQIPAIIALKPGFVWVQMITNDEFNGVPLATSIANCLTFIQAMQAAGIVTIFGADYPRSGMAVPYTGYFAQIMQTVRDYCLSQSGVIWLDCYGTFADMTSYANTYNCVPDTTRMLNESGSYVHPNAFGADRAAYAAAKQLSPYAATLRPSLSMVGSDGSANGDLTCLTTNPLMAGTTGTFGTGSSGTLPTGWYSQRIGTTLTTVASIVSRATAATAVGSGCIFDDGKNGNVTKLAISAATAGDTGTLSVVTPLNVAGSSGPYQSVFEYGVQVTSGTLNQLYSGVRDISFNYHNYAGATANAGDYALIAANQSGVITSRPYYAMNVAASIHYLEMWYSTSASAAITVYIANAGIRKIQA